MGSAFSGIELGKRSLIAHTKALQTTGHNIANAGTEGYSRQRVHLKEIDPLDEPSLNREQRPGQVGQGVDVVSVERIRDELLDSRLVSSSHQEGYWNSRNEYILMLEKVHNEPADLSVRARLDKFWESWQDLSQYPQEMPSRKAVLERGEALTDAIHLKYKNFKDVALMLNEDIAHTVKEINQYLGDIANLNVQIEKVKAMKDYPNDLLDRRDLLVDKLAALVPISIENKRDPDEFLIHMNGVHLVQGKLAGSFDLAGDPTNEGYWNVIRPDTKEKIIPPSGKLGALLELRDKDTRKEIQDLNTMTMHFSDLVNEIHQSGYGLNNETGIPFFVQYPAVLTVDGDYDRNGDGQMDSTYIFRMEGKNRLESEQQIGLEGTLTLPGPKSHITIAYYATDTVQDIINRINYSESEVSARLDREGRLSLKAVPSKDSAYPDFVIRHVEDSGQFLVGYSGLLAAQGPEGAFDWQTPQAVSVLAKAENPGTASGLAPWGAKYAVAPLAHPSAWIAVNNMVKSDPNRIAAGLGRNALSAEGGDGSGALAIAGIRNTQVMIGSTKTFDDYFARSVAEIGLKGETAQISLETQQKMMKDLQDLRDSLSGVNLDEEFSSLIKYQHGYNAAARFISDWNNMLDTIIKHMGV